MSAADYNNLPLHVRAANENPDEFVMENGYHHGDGVSPPGMGGWDGGQSDGGGKFRLKRRRRCGQCAPCLVKENCNKCQYCMRKDVLKQACIYRKCVYLRKPVPRFRQDPPPPLTSSMPSKAVSPPNNTNTNANNSVGGTKPPNASSQHAPPPQPPPLQHHHSHSPPQPPQPATSTSANSHNSTALTPAPAISTPLANHSVPPLPNHHSSEYSSCRLNQSPYNPLSSMQPRGPVFESNSNAAVCQASSVNHSKSLSSDTPSHFGATSVSAASSLAAPHPSKLDHSASINAASELNSAAAVAAAALNGMNSALGHPHHPATGAKGPSSLGGRDPYFPTVDPWSSMPYSLPRPTPGAWSSPSLTGHHHHHAAAAAYGFQQPHTPFPSSFTPSSCRLGLQDTAANSHFPSSATHQPSFHGMAGFTPDLSHAANSNLRPSAVNPSFYPTPPHLPPTTIPSFPSLTQFHSAQTSFQHSSYSMHPHPHMYPSGFYSSFRAPTEPQIYHAQIVLHQNPFADLLNSVEKEIDQFVGKAKTKSKNVLGADKLGIHDFFDLFQEKSWNLCGSLDHPTSLPPNEKYYSPCQMADNLDALGSDGEETVPGSPSPYIPTIHFPYSVQQADSGFSDGDQLRNLRQLANRKKRKAGSTKYRMTLLSWKPNTLCHVWLKYWTGFKVSLDQLLTRNGFLQMVGFSPEVFIINKAGKGLSRLDLDSSKVLCNPLNFISLECLQLVVQRVRVDQGRWCLIFLLHSSQENGQKWILGML